MHEAANQKNQIDLQLNELNNDTPFCIQKEYLDGKKFARPDGEKLTG